MKLRHLRIGQEAVFVQDFVLRRDAGTFVFKRGVFHLLEPVNGRITGAVFLGDGEFSITPPSEIERKHLAELTRGKPFVDAFKKAVFRFTDGADEEIKKAARPQVASPSGDGSSLLNRLRRQLHMTLRYNLDARLLQDVLSSQPSRKFIAFIDGDSYKRLVYDVDPQGVVAHLPCSGAFDARPEHMSLEPEEVALYSWDFDHCGIWTAFHFSSEYANGAARSDQQNASFAVAHQKLYMTLKRDSKVQGIVQTTVTALRDGLRVLPFDLFEVLRVQAVSGEDGRPLEFVQENIDQDADFSVVLPRELKRGESYAVTTKYKGRNRYLDVVRNLSDRYYHPAGIAWYPRLARPHFTTYDMTLLVPRGRRTVASGKLLQDIDEGNQNLTRWRSEAPQLGVDFVVADFQPVPSGTTEHSSTSGAPYVVQTFLPRIELRVAAGRSHERMTDEAEVGLELFRNYFGDEAYKSLAVSSGYVGSGYGGGAGLVLLPFGYFNRSGVQTRLGFDNMIGPEILAREWWGQTVAFASYRDQWMRGFAEMSASLFLETVYREHGLDQYHQFWSQARRLLAWRTFQGQKLADLGPLTVAPRLPFQAYYRETDAYSLLDTVPHRGAYILQMIRFMLQENGTLPDQPFVDAMDEFNKTYGDRDSTAEDFNAILRKHIAGEAPDPDARFKALMHEFNRTYTSRLATTEDFKALLEKYMTPEMDVDGTHTMDWFFNEYVYGSAYPSYRFEHSLSPAADGTLLRFKLQQSHVDNSFVMLVPIYVEMQDGRIVRVASVRMRGNQTLEREISLKDLPGQPKRAWAAYFDDVLGNVDNK